MKRFPLKFSIVFGLLSSVVGCGEAPSTSQSDASVRPLETVIDDTLVSDQADIVPGDPDGVLTFEMDQGDAQANDWEIWIQDPAGVDLRKLTTHGPPTVG